MRNKKMKRHPEIKDQTYHEMSFNQIDEIRSTINSGNLKLLINESELFLYLNQMDKRYSSRLKMLQNLSILSFIGIFIFLFINWKLSPVLFFTSIVFHKVSRNKAKQYIFTQCLEDRAFLKFALATQLVKLHEPSNRKILNEL